MPRIITIAREYGSGGRLIAQKVAEKVGLFYYDNEVIDLAAKEMGMDVTTFNEYVKSHPEIDIQIEKSATEYAKEHDNFIIDARLGWYAVPESFKVYLTVDIDEAARRAFYDEKRKSTENFASIEEQKADMQKRYRLENERYFKLYQVHKEDLSNYDFVMDTTHITPEEAAEKIKVEYEKWLAE